MLKHVNFKVLQWSFIASLIIVCAEIFNPHFKSVLLKLYQYGYGAILLTIPVYTCAHFFYTFFATKELQNKKGAIELAEELRKKEYQKLQEVIDKRYKEGHAKKISETSVVTIASTIVVSLLSKRPFLIPVVASKFHSTHSLPNMGLEKLHMRSVDDLKWHIKVLYAGHIAVTKILGQERHVVLGGQALQEAMEIAAIIVKNSASFGTGDNNLYLVKDFSDETQNKELKDILDQMLQELYKETSQLIEENRGLVNKFVDKLSEVGTFHINCREMFKIQEDFEAKEPNVK